MYHISLSLDGLPKAYNQNKDISKADVTPAILSRDFVAQVCYFIA